MLQKKIISYVIICGLALAITYSLHNLILNNLEVEHPFSLWKIYLFQSIATLILCAVFEIIAEKADQLKGQLGFLYLGAMALKIMFFCIIFSDIIFSSNALSKIDSLSLLVPVFIFLIIEVLIIVKILNRNH